MQSVLLAFFLLAGPCFAAAEEPHALSRRAAYRIVYDLSGKGGLEAGVVSLSNISALTYRGYNALADTAGLHRRWYLRPLSLTLIMLALPDPQNMLHEYYGHGAALREYGFGKDAKYSYGYFMGAEGRAYSEAIQARGSYEARQQWIAGGLASAQFYLLDYEKEMYRTGRMDLRALKPLFAANSDLAYLHSGLDANRLNDSSDGASWLRYFKEHYNNSQPLAEDYAGRAKAALDKAITLNPATYWAAATVLHYLWTGDDRFYAPALPLAGLRFGFTPKANLTPLGPENYYYLFIARGETLASLYLRSGESPEGKISGYGAELGAINLFGLGLTPGYDAWKLPAGGSPQLPSCKSGYSAHLKLDLPVYKALGLTGKAAFKTRGYLLGQPSGAGLSGYAGISLTF
jgi:hypothetical protein